MYQGYAFSPNQRTILFGVMFQCFLLIGVSAQPVLTADEPGSWRLQRKLEPIHGCGPKTIHLCKCQIIVYTGRCQSVLAKFMSYELHKGKPRTDSITFIFAEKLPDAFYQMHKHV